MSISCSRHRLLHLTRPHSTSWAFLVWTLVLPFVYKYKERNETFPGSLMREQMSLKVRRQTSSLVFIFLFCIRLKVQRVSCSTVKYLYIHMYLSQFILFGIHTFSCLSCSSFLWMQLPCFGTQLIAILFVHSFNIVLRILFAKKMSYCCLYLCTHIYI